MVRRPSHRSKRPIIKKRETPIEKTFFCHGFESGIRLRTAARGYERRKDVMSFSSSTEPPVALAKGMKAGRG